MEKPELRNVVFLDRDGVINEDSPGYIKSWAEVVFIPGSLEALRRLTEAGFTLIVISNQSAVGRNLMTRHCLDYMTAKMLHAVEEAGGRITDLFYCPHVPEDRCDCRKPLPGLIHQACEKYHVDLLSASMIGDSARDMECARAAGCGCSILVRTGNGQKAQKELAEKGVVPTRMAADLLDAAMWLIENHAPDPAA
ncbi:MAG: D-glycero-beta-D-manno-heptose 1,7-bisphosphate 7-phosphatase [Thermodesulfobacteriota bacterium]